MIARMAESLGGRIELFDDGFAVEGPRSCAREPSIRGGPPHRDGRGGGRRRNPRRGDRSRASSAPQCRTRTLCRIIAPWAGTSRDRAAFLSPSAGARTEVVFSAVDPSTVSLAVLDRHTHALFGSRASRWHHAARGRTGKDMVERRGDSPEGRCAGPGTGCRDRGHRRAEWSATSPSFAASLYMRGCGLVLVPTTLLAMVDASLGGKTGDRFHGLQEPRGHLLPCLANPSSTLPRSAAFPSGNMSRASLR